MGRTKIKGSDIDSSVSLGGGSGGGTSTPSDNFATGGVETSVGNYKIHTFIADGSFIVTKACKVELLLVGGGGSGGDGGSAYEGGGGGAGGLIHKTNYALQVGVYGISIGPGGVQSNGGNTLFGSLFSALGGGRGGSSSAGYSGASGGGGTWSNNNPGSGTPGQGNDGGRANSSQAGGGGGAGQAGNANGQGYGGNGLAFDISGAMTYYAGGGTGQGASGLPGIGGGGGINPGTNGNPGIANTGGGGGGGYQHPGGNGGSGIVIVRYDATQSSIPAIDSFGEPSDNTNLNSSISAHGLLPKLPGDATKYLDGTGAWRTPLNNSTGGGGGISLSDQVIGISNTALSVSNSTAETDVFTGASLRAGDLGANGQIRIITRFDLTHYTVCDTTIRVYYGLSVAASFIFPQGSVDPAKPALLILAIGNTSANSQNWYAWIDYQDGSLKRLLTSGTANIDTNGELSVKVTVQHSVANANNSYSQKYITLEKLVVGNGGGSSISLPVWITNHPDTPPSAPNAMDDEFDGTSLDSKWTSIVIAPATISIPVGSSQVFFYSPASYHHRHNDIWQTVPSGAWKFRAKLAFELPTWNFYGMGLGIRNSSNAYATFAGLMLHSGYGQNTIWAGHMTDNSDGLIWEIEAGNIEHSVWYAEIEFDGANTVIWRFSTTGKVFTEIYRENISGFIGTLNQVGIMNHAWIDGANYSGAASCDWFRRTS